MPVIMEVIRARSSDLLRDRSIIGGVDVLGPVHLVDRTQLRLPERFVAFMVGSLRGYTQYHWMRVGHLLPGIHA